jgi:hypothetical protein
MSLSAEQIELSQLETCMQRGLEAFYQAGQALRQIRDKRLYRHNHDTFEDYCLARWKLTRPRAYQLMEASQVVENLSTFVDKLPAIKESQTRPLQRIEPELQAEAWQAAQAIAHGKPTAALVSRAAEAVKSKPQEFEPGRRVRVLDEGSPLYGREVEVVEAQGVIVQAKTADGSTQPFLRNELASDRPRPIAPPPQHRTKADYMESLEARLEVAELRNEALEAMIKRLIEVGKENRIDIALLMEAEGLV